MTVGNGWRRVTGAVLAVRRALREDLLTTAVDPLPPLSRPVWLAWLPHVLVVIFALSRTAQFFTGRPGLGRLAVLIAGIEAGALVIGMFRPVPAWWTATIATAVGAVFLGGASYLNFTALAAQLGTVFLLALRVRPRAGFEALAISIAADLTSTAPDLRWVSEPHALLLPAVAVFAVLLRARRVADGQLVRQEELTAEERARRIVLEERGRIARELHDVVAHHLSVISIQAQVAPHLVADPPPELTENLSSIRQNAIEALTELRRVLGVLRLPDLPSDEVWHAPQPTLDGLDGLVANVRAAGVTVATETTGVVRPLSPGVALSAFRLVQEALSNAIRHAPGAAVRVAIDYRAACVIIRIRNTVPDRPGGPGAAGGGHGLLGMRERTAMLGGELAAGPTPDGGYEVTACLPAANPEPAKDLA